MSDDEVMDNLIDAYCVFASKGIRCVTLDGEDLTEDIVRIAKKRGVIEDDG